MKSICPKNPYLKKWNKRIFNVYLLSDINFLSGIYETKFSDCDKLDIKIAFEIEVEKLYKKIRKTLNQVVYEEFRDHFNFRTYRAQSYGAKFDPLIVVKNEDLFTIKYCFEKIKWHRYYGGKKWGKATDFLLQNPKSADEKMYWIDRVLDLEHNSGGIFHGKEVGFDDLYEKRSTQEYRLKKQHTNGKSKINLLDIRAIVPSHCWSQMCENKLWNSVYKYVKRLKPIFERIN